MKQPEHTGGKVIIIEGPDAIGKSLQLRLAAEELAGQGIDVHATRAHGGTAIGEQLRKVSLSDVPRTAFTDLLLSRTIHAELAHDIQRRRSAGVTTLIDRGPLSMWGYQVWGSGLSETIAKPIVEADLQMFDPDLVIVYSATQAVLEQRRAGRPTGGNDYFENQPEDFHERVADGYKDALEQYGGVEISADGTVDVVHRLTMNAIWPLFRKEQ